MQIQRQTKDTPKSNKTNMTFFISKELAKSLEMLLIKICETILK